MSYLKDFRILEEDKEKRLVKYMGQDKNVVIPSNVTSIDSSAFEGCTSLKSVVIPDSVTSIRKEAFKGCTSLTSITIPDSVTSISKDTFQGCTSLTIYVREGSFAEKYAKEKNIEFETI